MIPQDQVQRARQADLVEYLYAQGYDLQPEGTQFRVPGQQGLIVEGNHWFQHGSHRGGNTLDFLTEIEGIPFPQAVEALTGIRPTSPATSRSAREPAPKEFVLPERAPNDHRVFAYLMKTRGLPGPLVTEVVKAKLLYQDIHGNCVFPTLDGTGTPRGAILRGTYTLAPESFKGRAAGSDLSCGWHWPPAIDDPARAVVVAVVVESPIDALSLCALRPQIRTQAHVLALGGLHDEAVIGFLGRHPVVTRVALAFDNDRPGQEAAERLRHPLESTGKEVVKLYPLAYAKDWNEELLQEHKLPHQDAPAPVPPRYYTPRPLIPKQDRER